MSFSLDPSAIQYSSTGAYDYHNSGDLTVQPPLEVVGGGVGPRLAKTDPVEAEEVIDLLIATTNQTRGSLLAVLSELDVILERSFKAGKAVKLPNGITFRPVGKKDGSLSIKSRFSSRMSKAINIGQNANWINAENIDKTEEEMIVIWNGLHPGDPIEEWYIPLIRGARQGILR